MKIALVNLSKFQKFRTVKNFKRDFNFLVKNNIEFVDYCFDYSKPADLLKGFYRALKNPDVDLVWFVRGGDKLMRFFDKIDWNLVKKANKKYIGFSDPTNFFFKAVNLGQTCYYGTNLRRIGEHINSKAFNKKDYAQLIDFFKTRKEVKYDHKNLFKKVDNFEKEKVVGGHLIITTFMLQQMKFNLSNHFLMLEYHLTSGDTIGELEFFVDQLKIVIKNNLPKGFVLGFSQVYSDKGILLKPEVINQCFVDNLKEYGLPIVYINHLKQPVKLSL